MTIYDDNRQDLAGMVAARVASSNQRRVGGPPLRLLILTVDMFSVNVVGMQREGLSVKELAAATGLPVRTLRYYVAQGLLATPVRAGRLSRYPESTLRRAQLLKVMRAKGVPLAEIRTRLTSMSEQDVSVALGPPRSSHLAKSSPISAFAGAIQMTLDPAAGAIDGAAPPSTDLRFPNERTQWDRMLIEPGVELHVQRPLTRLAARRVQRVIAFARQLVEGDASGSPS